MNKKPPVSNKYLNKIWQDFNKQLHNKRLKEITSTTEEMMKSPRKMAHLNQNGKKWVLLDEKYTEIERENHMLLRKMKDILSSKSHTINGIKLYDDEDSSRPCKVKKSLNYKQRK